MLDKADEYIEPRDRETENDRVVGANIRRLRIIRGMSQMDMASHFDMSYQQFQKVEAGVNRIGAGRLFELARLLTCEVSAFYEGIETPDRVILPSRNDMTRDTMAAKVVEAYANIKSRHQRQLILDLMRSMAEK